MVNDGQGRANDGRGMMEACGKRLPSQAPHNEWPAPVVFAPATYIFAPAALRSLLPLRLTFPACLRRRRRPFGVCRSSTNAFCKTDYFTDFCEERIIFYPFLIFIIKNST